MDKASYNYVKRCLPQGRTPFYYFKDRYALQLLRQVTQRPKTKRDLEKSPFGKLLNKAIVKQALSGYGSGPIESSLFEIAWPRDVECYLLTFGYWQMRSKRWAQTTRHGGNLVLQLNFSSKHDEAYRRLVDPVNGHPFECRYHPISKGKLRTLAWSRLDINLDGDEALIEEIQNDWIRMARASLARIDAADHDELLPTTRERCDKLRRYVDEVLAPHIRLWDEAMLAATIWFLHEVLNIGKIWYHTPESGARLKQIDGTQPPRSLYTTLPKKFCFRETDEKPHLLPARAKHSARRRALQEARFQALRIH